MAIYSNLTEVTPTLHWIFESSNLKATDIGNLYDALIVDAINTKNPIDCDNAVAIKMLDYTGNGLQERYAIKAGKKDKIAVTGSPAVVKNHTAETIKNEPFNFYNKAGKDAKAYEVVQEDIFGVSKYAFTEASQAAIKEGNYVVWNGTNWVAQAAAPTASEYGFIGKVHSVSEGSFYDIVRIFTIENEQK